MGPRWWSLHSRLGLGRHCLLDISIIYYINTYTLSLCIKFTFIFIKAVLQSPYFLSEDLLRSYSSSCLNFKTSIPRMHFIFTYDSVLYLFIVQYSEMSIIHSTTFLHKCIYRLQFYYELWYKRLFYYLLRFTWYVILNLID